MPLLSLVAALITAAAVPCLAATNSVGGADGSFETDLSGFVTEGDVRIVPSYGVLFPTEGNRALLMTTAPDAGSTPADAGISRLRIESFEVPAGFSQIRLDYDFLTNEPAPSRTNDRFRAELVLVTAGGTETLLQVDTYRQFHPIPFSEYDRHTGFDTLVADVSAYAGTGELLTLELRVEDVGDGRHDSAVFLDNLRLVEPGAPVARLNVDYLEVDVDEVIPFDASGSTDDGTIVEYRWDFGNGFHGFGTFVDFPYFDDGVFQGTMTVTDDDGNTDTATFTIVVGDPNHGPQILSTPVTTAREGVQYVYQVLADDPEVVFGDQLTFSLTEAPQGMGVDPQSGRISWIPPQGVPVSNPVTVRVEDSLGLFDEQSYTVTIDASTFIIATDDNGRVYYARSAGDGTWTDYRQQAALPGVIRGVTIADFDNDGDWDFVVPAAPGGNTLDFHLFLNDGTDQFDHRPRVASSSAGSGGAYGMTAGDFDHDGNMDFLVSRNGVNVIVGLGDGKGGFAISEFSTGLGNGRGMDVADFDHDGHLDFVRSRYSSGQIHLWRGDGLGGFTNAGQVGDPGGDPYAVSAADLNNDGHTDFIANEGGSGNPYFYAGNGDGTFAGGVYVGSLDFNNHGKYDNYDFDRDGNQDLITVSYTSRVVRYYPGNGDGTFGAAVRVNPSNTPGNILGVAAPPGPAPAGDPIARISPDFVVAQLGATIDLSGASSSDDGTIVAYEWDFGDGQIASGVDVGHTFPAVEDDYVVRLTVTDDSGRVAIGSALVRLQGTPPVADSGGPYVFGEAFASGGAYTVTLDGSGSTDDGPAPLEYAWDLGNGLDGSFGVDAINPGVWTSAGASPDGFGAAVVTGAGSWGNRYLFTNRQYPRRAGDSYTGRVVVRSGSGNKYVMWGLKNTGTNYSYTQLYYAIYFNNGNIRIYESGSDRGAFSSYSTDTSYDVRIDVKSYAGATYYVRQTGTPTWTQIYNSGHSAASPFRVGATVHSGTIEFPEFGTPGASSTAEQPSVTYPGLGVYDVELTVTDVVEQADGDATTVTLVAGDPPVADAGSPTVTEADANCGQWTVSFDGTGSSDDNGIYRYEWDFGDGQTGTGATPNHTYATAGDYTVTLTVTDHALQQDSATTEVTTPSQDAPVADPGGPYAVDEGAANAGFWTAVFSGAASSDDFGICDYSWDFGDGGTGSGQNPTHPYAAAGTYTVTLTVRDNALQSHSASTTIVVAANDPPTSNPGGPYAVDESNAAAGLWTATFNGTGSTDDFGIWTYAWDFGDGGTGAGPTPTHVYSAPGTYDVTLTVTDNGRQTDSAQTQIVVGGNLPPVAEAGLPTVTEVGHPVTLDATGSTDDFGIFSYLWDLDVPPFEDFSAGVIDPSVWASSGANPVGGEVVVTGAGSWTDRYLVTADSHTRVPGESYRGRILVESGSGDENVMWGLKDTGTNYSYTQFYYAIYFANGSILIYESGTNRGTFGSYSDDTFYDVRIDVKGAGATYYVRPTGTSDWTLLRDSGHSSAASLRLGATINNGTIHLDDITITKKSDQAIVEVSYPVPGTYQPTVTVTDHALQTDTDSTVVTVLAGDPPVPDAGGPYTTNEGFPTRFDASGSTDDFGILSYAWDFGDGEGLATRNAWIDHVYTVAADYTVTLTVTDYAGHAVTETMIVSVTDEPVVAAVPWRFLGATEVPHDVVSGREAKLKAVAWSLSGPVDYTWDFGDGTPTESGTATNLRAIQATHTYTGVEGRRFDATVTVTDANGRTASDTYRLRIVAPSLFTDINIAIDEGLWRLHKDQLLGTFSAGTYGNARIDHGRWNNDGGWPHNSGTANWVNGPTSSAVQAFQVNGNFELGDARRNPYVETVARGMRYLPYALRTITISNQTYGDPDTNGNGFGIETRINYDGRPAYEVGQVMDGFIATGSQDTYAITGGSGLIHRTYRDLVIDMADAYAWGQYDHPTVGGGWRYGWNTHPDNSVVQWGAIGMIPAERLWNIEIPEFVKERLHVWLNYSYNGTGFGYTGGGNGRNTTPSGLVELAFIDAIAVDDPDSPGDDRDPRWATAENYIASQWNGSFWYPNGSSSNKFSYYAYYAFTKAMRLARPEPIVRLGATDLDWFFDETNGIARRLVTRQDSSGGWPRDGNPGGTYVGYDLTNAWSVIMLQALFEVPPVADAGPDRVWGVDVEITIDGCGSYHPDEGRGREIVLYEWDVDGDGVYDVSGPDCTVTHTYAPGDYPTLPAPVAVGLRVSDNRVVDGVAAPLTGTDSATITLTLPPHPPLADADGPYLATAGIPIELDGSGSFDINPTDFISAWEWDLDNDGEYDDATGERPVVIFDTITPPDQPASIGLRVLDNGVLNDLNGNGEVDPEERLEGFAFTEVTVIANTAPVADANGPYSGDEGTAIALDASGSSDPEDNPITYAWDLDDDGAFDDAAGSNPGFDAIDDGVYPVAVEVSDSLLTDVASSLVTVNNVPPDLAPIPDATFTDDPAIIGGSFSDPGVQDTHIATIDWGEGAGPVPATVNQGAGSGTVEGSHVYAADGTYQVTVTVTDDDGGVDVEILTITVERNEPPVADAGGPYNVAEGSSIPVSAANSFDPNPGDVLTFEWDLDADGVFETPGETTTFFATDRDGPDSQQIFVRVTDPDGAFDVASATVTIENLPPTADAGGPYTVLEGDTVPVSATGTDPGGDTLSYAWDLDADGVFETPGQTATFSAVGREGPDTQEIFVLVTDDDGATAVDSAIVTIVDVVLCGNGTIEPGEDCDGANLGGESCESLGFLGGTLTCNDSCGFDTTGCLSCPSDPAPELVNDRLVLEALTTVGVSGNPPIFPITSTFRNVSSDPITGVFFVTVVLQGAGCPCLVANADGGPGGVGTTVTVDLGDDVLMPDETFTQTFDIQLTRVARFTFFVNVWGTVCVD